MMNCQFSVNISPLFRIISYLHADIAIFWSRGPVYSNVLVSKCEMFLLDFFCPTLSNPPSHKVLCNRLIQIGANIGEDQDPLTILQRHPVRKKNIHCSLKKRFFLKNYNYNYKSKIKLKKIVSFWLISVHIGWRSLQSSYNNNHYY